MTALVGSAATWKQSPAFGQALTRISCAGDGTGLASSNHFSWVPPARALCVCGCILSLTTEKTCELPGGAGLPSTILRTLRWNLSVTLLGLMILTEQRRRAAHCCAQDLKPRPYLQFRGANSRWMQQRTVDQIVHTPVRQIVAEKINLATQCVEILQMQFITGADMLVAMLCFVAHICFFRLIFQHV